MNYELHVTGPLRLTVCCGDSTCLMCTSLAAVALEFSVDNQCVELVSSVPASLVLVLSNDAVIATLGVYDAAYVVIADSALLCDTLRMEVHSATVVLPSTKLSSLDCTLDGTEHTQVLSYGRLDCAALNVDSRVPSALVSGIAVRDHAKTHLSSTGALVFIEMDRRARVVSTGLHVPLLSTTSSFLHLPHPPHEESDCG